MVVLSLFDGMSCGRIALRLLGISVERYYASEVDKYAIHNTMHNFPDTIQLGDVRNIDATKLGKVDLLIGGSPCQSLSFAGKRAGMSTKTNEKVTSLSRYLELKNMGFEFEGQSYLFWEYVRVLGEIRKTNPNVLFMLENVEMGKQWEDVIDNVLGVRGVHINSALVSAQVRKRIYWTNIRTRRDNFFAPPVSDIPQPTDKGIYIRDILETSVEQRYYLKPETVKKLLAVTERRKLANSGFGPQFHTRNMKASAVTVGGRNYTDLVICVAQRGRAYRDEKPKFEPSPIEGKTNCLTTVGKDNLILQRPRGFNTGNVFADKSPTVSAHAFEQNNLLVTNEPMQLNPSTESGGRQPYQQNRVYDSRAKSPALMVGNGGKTINILEEGIRVRRLTPTECARLQTIPDWYKWDVSETQQYRMIGNGWTIDVIKHILSFLPQNSKNAKV